MVKRTSLNLTQDRQDRLDRCAELIASGPDDEPPMADTIDAALQHLLESYENMNEARGEFPPEAIKAVGQTSVLRFHYRTSVDSGWRK